ncbi:P-loop NTPase fold protein [Tistrella mobilis]
MINEHTTKILDAYLDAKSLPVPHALLVEGSWGSGKTYFLQKIYEPSRKQQAVDNCGPHVPFLFVSLFGATSVSDVEMRIYKTACPAQAVAGSVAGTFVLGVGEFFRVKDATKGAIDRLGKKAIKRLNEFVFVFDDLERIEKQAFGEIMGLINSLITEHERRVILVADESKLKEIIGEKIWQDQHEKIIGRRCRINADFENVLSTIVNSLQKGPTKATISKNSGILLEIIRSSEVQNLRSLIWSLHSVAAFVNCLITDSEIPESHVVRTMSVVLATTLWLRSGLLDIEALEKIPGLSMRASPRLTSDESYTDVSLDSQVKKAKDFVDKFSMLSVGTPPVDYKFIKDYEKSGVIDQHEVNLWVKMQFGFGKSHSEASWRKLWYSYQRPIPETEQAILTLKSELDHFLYKKRGEILHIAGLAIRQSHFKDHRITDEAEVVAFFKKYIDALSEKNEIEAENLDALFLESDNFGGLGFMSRDTAEFKEIFKYIHLKIEENFDQNLRMRAENIIKEAEENDINVLYNLINPNEIDLLTKPILVNISYYRLACLISRGVPEMDVGARLLAYRYSRVKSGDPLRREIDWARMVYSAVVAKIKCWEEPHRAMALSHLENCIRHHEVDKESIYKIIY